MKDDFYIVYIILATAPHYLEKIVSKVFNIERV